jgi:hypothetical protein
MMDGIVFGCDPERKNRLGRAFPFVSRWARLLHQLYSFLIHDDGLLPALLIHTAGLLPNGALIMNAAIRPLATNFWPPATRRPFTTKICMRSIPQSRYKYQFLPPRKLPPGVASDHYFREIAGASDDWLGIS